MQQRAGLAWDGLLNVRDLGGHRTEDGGETRFGAVVRADSVRRLSDDGWAKLVAFGIRTIVDLRFDEELEADPPRELPVDVVHVPVLPGFDAPDWVEIHELIFGALDPASAQTASYLAFLERFRSEFGEAVAAVANAQQGGVLVHCQAGKDRTGLVVGLLLRLAGVGVEAIADDYALSGGNLEPVLAQWIAEGADERERMLRERVSACPRSTMIEVLMEIDHRYGGVHAYLLGAGVGEPVLERARSRLRE